jgi:ATP-binding cassette subfamily B protein
MTSPRPLDRLSTWGRRYSGRFALGSAMLLVTNALGYVIPKLLKRAIDSLSAKVDQAFLGQIALAVLVIAVVQAGVRIASRLLIFNAARDIERDIRQGLFDHLLALSPERLRGHALGDLQSRMLNDLTNVRLIFGVGLLNIVNTALVYAIALPLMFGESPRLALVALAPYPVIIFVMLFAARRIFRLSSAASERQGELSNLINEDLGARLFITATGLQRSQEQRFAERNDRYLETNVRVVRTRALMFPIVSGLGSLGVALGLLVGGKDVMAGKMTLGALVAFTSYLGLLTFPTLMFGFMLALLQRGRASWRRIATLFGEPTWQGGTREVAITTPPVLHLAHATVRRKESVLIDDVSITIQPGERVGIVGAVGSGKSTLLAVLARLLEPTPGPAAIGEYTVGGEDARELSLGCVRAAIGLVPQQPFLFSASVRQNVCFGRPDCDDLTLERALETASVQAEIARLPQGLGTEIGERGVTLSGGQKQRLAIARALVIDPHVLLMDDCFSAVDSETERKIIAALFADNRRRTVVLATHRLAALDHMDRIVVMERGKIVEEGTPRELQQPGTRYYELHKRQRLAEQLEKASVA